MRTSLLAAALLSASQLEAAISTAARIGGGPGRFRGPGREAATSTFSGTLRLAYEEEVGFTAGIDAATFRIAKAPKIGLMEPIEGDQLGLFVGYNYAPWHFWVGSSAGQMRIEDPALAGGEGEADLPPATRRYVARADEFALSLDFYRALYGKIEGCLLWRRYTPETKWREKYEIAALDAWQFELGLKLLTW